MDSGWAVVVGATVAFIGSIIGTVLAPMWTAARDRAIRHEDDRREATRLAIIAITRGLGRMKQVRFDGRRESAFEETILAVTELALQLDPADEPIEHLATATINIVQNGTLEQVATAISVWQTTAHRWYRDEIPGKEVIERAQAEFDGVSGTIPNPKIP
jgi:hypothetical protein